MNTQKLQNDKLNLIQWITQIQDHTLIEKIKSLMSTSNDNLQLTIEQEVIRAVNTEPKLVINIAVTIVLVILH